MDLKYQDRQRPRIYAMISVGCILSQQAQVLRYGKKYPKGTEKYRKILVIHSFLQVYTKLSSFSVDNYIAICTVRPYILYIQRGQDADHSYHTAH